MKSKSLKTSTKNIVNIEIKKRAKHKLINDSHGDDDDNDDDEDVNANHEDNSNDNKL